MWCPKCKTEYQDGIMVCADCGTPLESGSADDFDVVEICSLKDEQMAQRFVEYLEYSDVSGARMRYGEESGIYTVTVPTGAERKAERLFQGFMMAVEEEKERQKEPQDAEQGESFFDGNKTAEEPQDSSEPQEYDWDAEEEADTEEDSFPAGRIDQAVPEGGESPKELLYTPAKEYVKKADEYKDLRFSGLTFILFGVAGLLYLLLCKLDIIPIHYHIVVFIGIAAMFVVFLALGVSSMMKSGRVKGQILVEEEKTGDIKMWLQKTLTRQVIQSWADGEVSEAENDLLVMARIRARLIQQYPQEDVAYLEMISEEYYNETIEEQN